MGIVTLVSGSLTSNIPDDNIYCTLSDISSALANVRFNATYGGVVTNIPSYRISLDPQTYFIYILGGAKSGDPLRGSVPFMFNYI